MQTQPAEIRAQLKADQVEWQATVLFADGTPTSHRFKMPRGATEQDAINRIFAIWTRASLGGALNPTLTVAPVDAARRLAA